jgi:hypothetical protein
VFSNVSVIILESDHVLEFGRGKRNLLDS